jgi:FMN-dependent NADH-azoreductase
VIINERQEKNMARILHVDASPRGERSISRMLTREFVEGWKRRHPDDAVTYRDVGHQPPPHVTEAWIVGAFAPPETHSAEARAAVQISDRLIEEFIAADRYVFGVPMHNFSVPSTFKCYVDQIVRVGRTFTADMHGLVLNKKMLIITARGGDYSSGTPTQAFDVQEPWLRTIFGFIGITDIRFIHAQGINLGDAARESALKHAHQQIGEILENW